MKSLKKIMFHLLLFIIFGLIYFIPLEYFWGRWSGYIFYVVLFILVELIYNIINKKKEIKKTKTKLLVTTSIIVGLLILFSILFCITDYFIAKSGKKPIFSLVKMSWSGYRYLDIEEMNRDEEKIMPTDAEVYYGIGYKIVVCHICKETVWILPLGIGNYPIEYLDCSSETLNTQDFYTFIGGKLDNIDQTQTFQINEITDIESYETDIQEINNIFGCSGDLEKDSSGYTIWKSCKLSKMSNSDITIVYVATRDKLNFSRKKLAKLLRENNNDMICKFK